MEWNSRRASGTGATPMAMIFPVDSPSIRSPAKYMAPDTGFTSPRMVFIVVVFPDALPPRRETTSPSKTSRLTSFRILIEP